MGKIVETLEFKGDKDSQSLKVLLDTGASVSVICHDIANKLTDHFVKRPPLTLRKVNGQKWQTVNKYVTLQVKMKDKWLDGVFYIVEKMPRPAIIGVDFMQRWEIKLNPKKHDFTVGVDPNAIEMG